MKESVGGGWKLGYVLALVAIGLAQPLAASTVAFEGRIDTVDPELAGDYSVGGTIRGVYEVDPLANPRLAITALAIDLDGTALSLDPMRTTFRQITVAHDQTSYDVDVHIAGLSPSSGRVADAFLIRLWSTTAFPTANVLDVDPGLLFLNQRPDDTPLWGVSFFLPNNSTVNVRGTLTSIQVVPIPPTAWLFGGVLGVLGCIKRRATVR
jgi:hypothetical protein